MEKRTIIITFTGGKPVTLLVTAEEAETLVADLKMKEWVIFKEYHFNTEKVNHIQVKTVPVVVNFSDGNNEKSESAMV
ncbi:MULTISPECIES: hypothetical protein [Paenibacillus]|uniref:Uncharacterized protein n=1 Tax=Paenibacillus pabuli TaxID=1472 RepID=A0A855XRB6_9BACL|nr:MULTISPECIES: hypothetical protein [Paenibacillus]PWW37377.1 hypothetical protein DET56_109263 [Paenibacillus pabuli]PXW05519.1 hypothetical protein DEU73_108262 [Paenibacillus taichungensis]